MKFGADYIPPSEFDDFHWLKSCGDGPVWHYWLRRDHPHRGEVVDLRTVDPLLRPLVKYAQENGLLTKPSCQGHFYDGAWIEQAHQRLVEEAEQVRNGTLPLYEVETSRWYIAEVPDWTPPELDAMKAGVLAHTGVGRIAFVWPDGREVEFRVEGKNPFDLRRKWERVYGMLREMVQNDRR